MATYSWWTTLWAAVLAPSLVCAAAPQGAGDGRAVTRMRPMGLAVFIDELGGQPVTLVGARVVAVVNPGVFVIESNLPRQPFRLDRVVVFIDAGVLRVDADGHGAHAARPSGDAGSALARRADPGDGRAARNPGRRHGQVGAHGGQRRADRAGLTAGRLSVTRGEGHALRHSETLTLEAGNSDFVYVETFSLSGDRLGEDPEVVPQALDDDVEMAPRLFGLLANLPFERVEAPVHLLEPPVHLLEPPVDRSKPSVDLLNRRSMARNRWSIARNRRSPPWNRRSIDRNRRARRRSRELNRPSIDRLS
jgi:hypothetical protein